MKRVPELGRCERCGSDRWWDNSGKKRSGQWKSNAPDYTCAGCKFKVWSETKEQRAERLAQRPPAVESEPVRSNPSSPFFS